RTHANYPWHHAALLRALGCPDEPDAVAAAIARRPAGEVEERVFSEGGVAAAVRPLEAWRAHPQGEALAAAPLVAHRTLGPAPARPRGPADLPMRGVRVLDLTRVIAGPVCTRFLAALGADVLRIDPPGHPDMPAGAASDTLLGKRSALLDLSSPDGLDAVHRLLDGADVAVLGYRPGALDRFGLRAEALAERHPGLVLVLVDAWGRGGPWSGRRGFDSIVQAACGIASGESDGGEPPGALPCQLLDHGTGYLAAAAALDAVRRQAAAGGTHARHLSLARTAWWLTAAGRAMPPAGPPPRSERSWTVDLDGPGGAVTAVAPPGRLSGRPLAWPGRLSGYGVDRPAWPDRTGRAAGVP
ncbi:MAG TPA: CoA transferase, partial [Candidatus Dormibacteraeota bacterium]